MPDIRHVRGHEFVGLVRALARQRGVSCRFDASRGKGSHGTLYYGNRRTIVPDLRRELKTGTLHGMLCQLGLSLDELR
jgi:mRNA interferase HicA